MEKGKIRVVIADDEPIIRMDLKELLSAEGYEVAGEAADGFDAVAACREQKPDLALLDIKMPLLDGLSAARIIFEEGLADTIIMLTAYSEREFVREAQAQGVSGYLIKPVDEKSLIPNIELAVARSREVRQLRREIRKVSDRLEGRTAIERAKGRLMARQGMDEQTAYDYIRRLSLEKKLSMRRVAELILMQPEGG